MFIPLGDNLSCKGKPRITQLLIAANCVWFFIELQVMGGGSMQRFFNLFAMTPDKVSHAFISGDPWLMLLAVMSIFTSMFIHGGWAHILGNMLFLLVFGPAVEARFGRRNYLLFYLTAGLAAAGLQFASAPFDTTWVLGASGAIAGVLGAYMLFWPKAKLGGIVFTPGPQWGGDISARLFLIYWIIAQFSGVLESIGKLVPSGIAYWAHIGGFLGGLVMAILWRWYSPISDVCYAARRHVCSRCSTLLDELTGPPNPPAQ